MTLNSYQKQTKELLVPTGRNIVSALLSITAKVGELSARLSLAIRYGQLVIQNNKILGISNNREANQKLENDLKLSVGDLLSRFTELCDFFGWDLEDICQMNLDKMAQIRERHLASQVQRENSIEF